MTDPYEALGVPKTATEAEIKAAFRRLSKENHPDRHPGDKARAARMSEINAAYAILGDPRKRKRFDETGEARAERTVEELAMAKIMEHANAVLDDERQQNVSMAVRARITQERFGREQGISNGRRYMRQLEKKFKAIKAPAGAHNIFADMVAGKLEQVRIAIRQAENELPLFLRAIEILAPYSTIEEATEVMQVQITTYRTLESWSEAWAGAFDPPPRQQER